MNLNHDVLKTSFVRILVVVIFLSGTFSCKKFVEDKKQQAAMSFITNGFWKVQSAEIDSVSITSEFEVYKFKFNDDNTVSAISPTETQSGTWLGNITDYSITSDFPSAGDPIKKLNGRWILKDSGDDYVKAERATSKGVDHLHMVKVL